MASDSKEGQMPEICRYLPCSAEDSQSKRLVLTSPDDFAKRSEEHFDSHVEESDLVSFGKELMRVIQNLKSSKKCLNYSLKIPTPAGPQNSAREVANRMLTDGKVTGYIRVHTLCSTLTFFRNIILAKVFDQTIYSARDPGSDRV